MTVTSMATLPSSCLQSVVIISLFYSLIIVSSVSRPSSCQQLDCVELLSYQLTYLLSIEQEETINGLRITATPESREPNENSPVYNNVISWPEPTSFQMSVCLLNVDMGTFVAVSYSLKRQEMAVSLQKLMLFQYLFHWRVACYF